MIGKKKLAGLCGGKKAAGNGKTLSTDIDPSNTVCNNENSVSVND